MTDIPATKPSWVKRIFWLLAAVIASLALILAWQTWRFPSRQIQVAPRPGMAVDANAAAKRLSAAVQLRTVWSATDANAAAFNGLRQLIQTSYPGVHAKLTQQVIGPHALLYTWPGTDPRAKPIALLAHQDVVSVAPGTEGDWKVPPFSGAIQDGFIWGRGTWDDKSSVMAILEAAESLVKAGFQPRQTLYLLFNADEEVGGNEGAAQLARQWRQQGVKLEWLLDEGMVITHGMVPGVKAPVALVGTSQKGYLTLQLTAKGQPGHSSQPPKHHAIGVLAEALQRLEEHPMPGRLAGLPREMMESVAAEADGPMRVVLSNLWLTRPLVERELAKTPAADAMLRTTAVPTILKAGELENVVPGVATATLNYRLLPGDTSQAVIAHVQQVVAGLDVSVTRQPKGVEAAAVSSTGSRAYQALARSVRELQPGTVVAPGLLIGGTDSIHFADLAETTLRFRPIHVTAKDITRIHGTNERIGVKEYGEMIQFYERLLRNINEP